MKPISKIREWLDSIFLSDHEWKKKYCPNLYNYLFKMTDEERRETNWAEKIREEIRQGKTSGFFIYAGRDSDHPIDFQERKKQGD